MFGSLGTFDSSGADVRYEHALTPQHAHTMRLYAQDASQRGAHGESEPVAQVLLVGYRYYPSRNFYLGGEVGVARTYEPEGSTFEMDPDYEVATTLGMGVKLSDRVDIGLEYIAPLEGIALRIGADLAVW